MVAGVPAGACLYSGNERRGREALTGFADPLSAANKALDWVDLVLCTAGPAGLYMAGFTEEEAKRKTQHPLLPGAIPEFNQFEFSRAMRHGIALIRCAYIPISLPIWAAPRRS